MIFDLLKETLPGYEERPGQRKMAEMISEEVHNSESHHVVLAEGPVGVGKSLAYIFGSLLNVTGGPTRRVERIIISTSGLTLQNQLITKDLPFVRSILGRPLTFAALKGITNFCCLRELYKMEHILKADHPDIWDMYEDPSKTEGEKPEELDYKVWNAISTSHNDCDGKDCDHVDKCYYMRRKMKAQSSDVVVINHSLLATHLYMTKEFGASILPGHDVMIIDECHDLEDNIINFLGGVLSMRALDSLMGRTKKARGKIAESKFLHQSLKERLLLCFDRMVPTALEDWDGQAFATLLHTVCAENKEGVLLKKRYSTKTVAERAFRIANALDKVVHEAEENEAIAHVGAVTKAMNGWTDVRAYLQWLEDTPPHVATWHEKEVIHLRPVNVDEFLAPYWENEFKKFILTSATVTVNQRFDYIKERLGIQCPTLEGVFESPFDYSKQVSALIIPKALNPKKDTFDEQMLEGIRTIVDKSPYDKTLVLCTSYVQMNLIVPEMRMHYSDSHLVLEQSKSMSKDFILSKFYNTDKAILVAQAASFGQGVDIKGDKNIIIVKLSFEVPNDPVFETKSRLFEGNDFVGLNVPIAALRVRQQVGRGIRSKEDRAIVAILDGRVLSSPWGRIIYNSLPKMKTYDKF